MKTNDLGVSLIKKYEGCRLKSYICPAGIWTIGYGNTSYLRKIPNPELVSITQEDAESFLQIDLVRFEVGLSRLLSAVKINENQFAALISFSFNVGLGRVKYSSLLKYVRQNPDDIQNIGYQLSKWCYAGGRKLNGLLNRRMAEFRLYSLVN